ncbi:MAG: hypothetical protein NPINA01_00810 [Nitrospinaceae bacterium]|nr:MAG: hypothetical protein NPINA01_00810 [Nitrospinaceae bacterium]
MKKPSRTKKLAVPLILLLIGVGAVWAIKIAPVMAELKDRDPGKFATMIAMVKSLDFEGAKKNYSELDGMTYEDILTVRYNSLKKKRQEDDGFRERQWESEWESREDAKALRKEERQNQLKDLIRLSEERPESALLMDWKKSGAWEKGLLLREKCIKYLKLERGGNRWQRGIHKLPKSAPLIDRPRESSLTLPEICEAWIPISHDETQVARSLENIKNNMDYFFFVQLLDEIGVPRQEVFSFPTQLDRMTGGVAGS